LQPGQGAPEAINPDEVELAVLREADTLDGPRVARVAPRKAAAPGSLPPRPVSVEVPRSRAQPPLDLEALTPKTPSARSVQSGTLMSIGSVDPRAPTELSLPSPRRPPVSSERPYPVPEAVVDHTPPMHPERREPMRLGGQAVSHSDPEWSPYARPAVSARPPVSSGRLGPQSSLPGYIGADSPAPAARNFAREPESYPGSDRYGQPPKSSSRPSSRYAPDPPPDFQIHAELDALPHDYGFPEDGFDLRGVSTQREPLAGRRLASSPEFLAEPEVAPEPASISQRGLIRLSGPSSSSAITLWVDRARARASSADFGDAEGVPSSSQPRPRHTVPLSWVVGAAFVGLTVAVLMLVAMRGERPAAPQVSTSDRAAAAPAPVAVVAPGTVVAQPLATAINSATPVANVPPSAHSNPSAPAAANTASGTAVSKLPALAASARTVDPASVSSVAHPASTPASAHGSVGSAPTELSPKSRQSIY